MLESESFLFAVFGGYAINIISLAELRNIPRSERPDTFSDWIYDIWFFVIPILGGVLAIAYQMSGSNLTPILAINVGVSTPLILKAFAAVTPQYVRNRRID